jgi:hypothetical protein
MGGMAEILLKLTFKINQSNDSINKNKSVISFQEWFAEIKWVEVNPNFLLQNV